MHGPAILKLITGAHVYAPEPLGPMDVLVAGGVIACVQAGALDLGRAEADRIDGRGKLLVPGFIDSHVHILGGGGEGGYATRTPELVLSDLSTAGVTTVVGCLGTDGTTRTMASLLAKARGLEAEGVTAYIYTGSYQVPVRTLTGSVQDDLILIDKVVGVGEIALSDHRSSQPTFQEVARVAAEARVGGMLSGKAGMVNVHMGDGPRMLGLIERILAETEIPAKHFVPTHMNRNAGLLQAGTAYALQDGGRGRFIDLTTSSVADEPERCCAAALAQLLRAGVAPGSISFSSDGQGSLPRFNAAREYAGPGRGQGGHPVRPGAARGARVRRAPGDRPPGGHHHPRGLSAAARQGPHPARGGRRPGAAGPGPGDRRGAGPGPGPPARPPAPAPGHLRAGHPGHPGAQAPLLSKQG